MALRIDQSGDVWDENKTRMMKKENKIRKKPIADRIHFQVMLGLGQNKMAKSGLILTL